ncbi:carbohydrate kinase [Lichenihabitans sp. Uapishka_5]|uniref:FGGY-family carbohydrate kinase n=1 Tax=Lichenihabitans sp. Uapishka_5 TaxID=3037302 RepID=UPI0029E7EB50|nr:FGGY-family carbohydrate kinase [Lichenihabitans sp. Uapishka_5]MDX7953112.1 carbohydrate kinase [Lichenihabitans sp. Uapishka_5]
MARDLLIGIDAGTSVIKSIAFTRDGVQVGVAATPNHYQVVEGAGAEQDMRQTWRDAAATLRDLATVVPDLAERTAAIAVTAQGDGTWLVDADGEPAGPALIWLDARSGRITEALRGSEAGRRIYENTGSGLVACQMGPQLRWLVENRPATMARAATAFHLKDWLYFKLTGVRAADASEGVHSFGDFRTLAYAPATLEALGLADRAGLLPPMVDGSRQTHRLSAAAAREIGFGEGLPVSLGPIDIVATGLGAGLYDPERETGCTIVGSTGCHMRIARSADAVKLNPDSTGYTLAFPVPGTFAQLQSNMASTLNIDWLVDLARGILKQHGVDKSRADIFLDLDDHVLAAEAGTILYHPYISEAGERGPFVDQTARAQFHGLTARHSFYDLMRAVYEGLGLAARDCYDAMGSRPVEVRITGGAARSKALRTILAAALGVPLRTSSREEAGAAGAAMVAAVATGFFPSMDQCIDRWVTPTLGAAQQPDPALARRYEALFPAYQAARRAAPPVWHAMADAIRGGVPQASPLPNPRSQP